MTSPLEVDPEGLAGGAGALEAQSGQLVIVVDGQALAAEHPSVVGAAGMSAAAGVFLNALGGRFTAQAVRLRTAGDAYTATDTGGAQALTL